MRAESTKCLPSAFLGVLNFHATAVLAHALVLDLAGDQREQRVIAADADAFARRDLRPALADKDGARADDLAAVDLDPEHLRVRVAAVARRAAAFLVSQLLGLLLGPPRRLLGRLNILFDNLGLGLASLGLASLGLRRGHLLLRRGLGAALRLGLVLRFLAFLLFDRETDAADGDDLECGLVSAAAMVHAHALLRLVADAFEAWAAAVRDHLGVDVEAVHCRITYLDLGAVVEEQHVDGLLRGTRLRGEPVDQDSVAGGYAVLLAAADDDGRQRTIRLGHGE